MKAEKLMERYKKYMHYPKYQLLGVHTLKFYYPFVKVDGGQYKVPKRKQKTLQQIDEIVHIDSKLVAKGYTANLRQIKFYM